MLSEGGRPRWRSGFKPHCHSLPEEVWGASVYRCYCLKTTDPGRAEGMPGGQEASGLGAPCHVTGGTEESSTPMTSPLMACAGLPQGHSCGLQTCADLEEGGPGRQHGKGVGEGRRKSLAGAEMAGLGEARDGGPGRKASRCSNGDGVDSGGRSQSGPFPMPLEAGLPESQRA